MVDTIKLCTGCEYIDTTGFCKKYHCIMGRNPISWAFMPCMDCRIERSSNEQSEPEAVQDI